MAVLEGGGALGADPLLQSDTSNTFGDYDKKGDIYARGCSYYQLLSSGGLCALYCQFYSPPVVELLSPVTGWDMDWAEGINTAKRILTARHAFNAREGVDHDSFQLPKRFLEPLVAGPAAGGTPPPFEVLREGYYEAMGWDAQDRVADRGDAGRAGDRSFIERRRRRAWHMTSGAPGYARPAPAHSPALRDPRWPPP